MIVKTDKAFAGGILCVMIVLSGCSGFSLADQPASTATSGISATGASSALTDTSIPTTATTSETVTPGGPTHGDGPFSQFGLALLFMGVISVIVIGGVLYLLWKVAEFASS